MKRQFRSLPLLFALFFLPFASSARADGDSSTYLRTPANAAADASFTLSQDIYVTNWYTRQVCEDVPYTQEETYYTTEWVPNNVFVCNTDADGNQQCSWVDQGSYQQVPHTREVTYYQTECHDEQYSQEDYDHTWNQPVVVHFPADASLLAGETETIVFNLAGDESAPALGLDQSNAVFHYVIAAAKMTGKTLDITLATKPFLTPADVGPANISGEAIEFGDQESVVSFTDKFSHHRVDSTYSVSVSEKGSATVLATGAAVAADGKKFSASLPVVLDPAKDYDVSVAVSRSGVVLVSSPIAFTVKKTVKAEVLDQAKLKNANLIGSYSIVGLTNKAVFRFKDLSPDYATVSTSYAVQVSELGPDKKSVVLGTATISRHSQKTDAAGRILVSLADDLKLDPAILDSLTKGKVLTFGLVATRHSKRFSPDILLNRTVSLALQK
jgi:hypothetical protein